MLVDLSVIVSAALSKTALDNEKLVSMGHLGTHFDVMNKEFPLAFTRRRGIVFDVGSVCDRDVEEGDVDMSLVGADMFVAFHTGFMGKEQYGSKAYFAAHPQLSNLLIDRLLGCGISIIGLDFAGLRRGREHQAKDRYCADRGVFVVENLCNLERVLDHRMSAEFIAHTYPINFEGLTGLPCRVVAEVSDLSIS